MRYAIIVLFLPTLLLAQEFEFQFEPDSIPVEIDGWHPWAPFAGGENESYPQTCDIDADGDLDLFVGNFAGYVTYYENQGDSLTEEYKFITHKYANVDLSGFTFYGRTTPTFYDIDADGDYDLFTGDGIGLIHYWNNAGSAQNPNFQFVTDSLGYIDVNGYNKLAFWDVDLDGDYDLFIGDYTGKIKFYRNIGTSQLYAFSLVTNNWLNMDVGENSAPCFVDIDDDHDLDLFIGNAAGRIWYYHNNGDSANYNFVYVTNYYNNIDVDAYAAPEFADLDGDGDYDLLVGRNQETPSSISPGDIYYYENIGSSYVPQWVLRSTNYLSIDEGLSAKNTSIDIDADLDVDLFVWNAFNNMGHYLNTGLIIAPQFDWISDNYQGITVNGGHPCFGDLDGDQDPDLLIGETILPNPPYPGVFYYRNRGTPQTAQFTPVSSNLVPGNYYVGIIPSLADIDGDGDLDLFLSDNQGTFYFFQNTGTSSQFNFTSPVLNWQGISSQVATPSCFYDIDDDSDLDLFMTPWYDYNLVRFYRNTGNTQNPNMVLETSSFLPFEVPKNYMGIDIKDIDGDGDGDFILAVNWSGGLYFFRNVTGQSPVDPRKRLVPTYPTIDLTLQPNPGNPVAIVLSLPAPQPATLAVYNLLGAKVATLTSGWQPAGQQRYFWETTPFASGVYLVRLEAGGETLTKKLTVVK